MASSLMVDRNALGATMAAPGVAPTTGTTNWSVVPRCTIEVVKCKDGCKIYCRCDDDVACGTLQNLCRALFSGQCSLCCQWNGVTVLDCKLCCGHCTCEMTEDGCCISCCSGDEACCAMIQACCDAVACCIKNGCCCYVCCNGAPICCCCC